jgi:hypothetical protein
MFGHVPQIIRFLLYMTTARLNGKPKLSVLIPQADDANKTWIYVLKEMIVVFVFVENPFKMIDNKENWLSQMTEQVTMTQ